MQRVFSYYDVNDAMELQECKALFPGADLTPTEFGVCMRVSALDYRIKCRRFRDSELVLSVLSLFVKN